MGSRSGVNYALEGVGGAWFNVKDHGAAGDGSSDDAAAFQAAIDAATAGDTIFIPRGDFRIRSALTVGKVLRFLGTSGNAPGSTAASVRTDQGNHDVFQVSSAHVVFEHLLVGSTGTATAGAGIVLSSGTYARIRDCRFKHFKGVHATNASRWNILDSVFGDCAKYGVHVDNADPDAGDWTIQGCTFIHGGTADAAIRLDTAAGRIVNNKIQHHTHGIDLQVADGETTPNLQITANSIEDQATANIRIGRAGSTGVMRKVLIVGNEMLTQANSAKNVILAAGIEQCVVVGNQLRGTGTSTVGADVTGGSHYVFDGNGFQDVDTGIQVAAGVTHVSLGSYVAQDVTTPISNSSTSNYQNKGTATVANGSTTVAVTHGLADTPALTDIQVTPTNDMGNATHFWITSPTSTQFTVNVDSDPGASTATFVWQAHIV